MSIEQHRLNFSLFMLNKKKMRHSAENRIRIEVGKKNCDCDIDGLFFSPFNVVFPVAGTIVLKSWTDG